MKGERGVAGCCKLLVPLFLTAVQAGLITMFLDAYEIAVILHSTTFISICVSLENGLSCMFRAIASFFYKKVQGLLTMQRQQSTGLQVKEWIQYGVKFLLVSYSRSTVC